VALIYFRKSSALYHADADAIVLRFDRPRPREKLQQIQADVICEVDRAGELVRVLVLDHKRLRLGLLLAHFTPMDASTTPGWGCVTYDPGARLAAFYLVTPEENAAVETASRRAVCEIDAAGRLLSIVIPVSGRRGEIALRRVTARLPAI
jgi:uncharacterized protein YuzE